MPKSRIAVSIVSHRQAELVEPLMADLASIAGPGLEVRLTVNVPEIRPRSLAAGGMPVKVIENSAPKGFAANHNAAFRVADCEYFCVVNPDIRLEGNPFPVLIDQLRTPGVGVAAPLVLDPAGAIEDSARRFPTLGRLVGKALRLGVPAIDYPRPDGVFEPDWVAGMFMLFRAETYAALGGFDEGYFLYYEDVDLCARLRLAGKRVAVAPGTRVVHHARRASRRSPRHAWWHLGSIGRYLLSDTYSKLRVSGATRR